MSWKDKIVDAVTGRTAQEREAEKKTYAEIRALQREAYLKAKKENAVKLARHKATAETNARIRKINEYYAPKKQTISSPFGGGSLMNAGMSQPLPRYNVMTGAYSAPNPMTRRQPVRKAARRGRSRGRTRGVYRTVGPQPTFRPFGW